MFRHLPFIHCRSTVKTLSLACILFVCRFWLRIRTASCGRYDRVHCVPATSNWPTSRLQVPLSMCQCTSLQLNCVLADGSNVQLPPTDTYVTLAHWLLARKLPPFLFLSCGFLTLFPDEIRFFTRQVCLACCSRCTQMSSAPITSHHVADRCDRPQSALHADTCCHQDLCATDLIVAHHVVITVVSKQWTECLSTDMLVCVMGGRSH